MSVTSLPSSGLGASIQEHPNESELSTTDPALSSSEGRANSSDAPLISNPSLASAPAFGEGNTLLTQVNPKDAAKKRKPKNNMTKSNSSFISRVIVHETLSKRLQERPSDGLYAFANINRAFQWLDMSSSNKVQPCHRPIFGACGANMIQAEYLTKVLFTKAHCLCHDVNILTKSAAHIDVIMGFSTGEIIWWEPISQRYTRLNKNVCNVLGTARTISC